MTKLFRTLLTAASFLLTVPVFAAEHGTPDEAVAMVQKVISYIKTNGKEKAIAEVNSQKQFIDRDMYIFIGDANGTSLAHGGNPRLVGKNLTELKDVEGKAFVKEGIEILKNKQSGWVDYKWPNPVTKQIEHKSLYFEKFGDLVISCGVYKS
jgi:signal transduction histidine kinase